MAVRPRKVATWVLATHHLKQTLFPPRHSTFSPCFPCQKSRFWHRRPLGTRQSAAEYPFFTTGVGVTLKSSSEILRYYDITMKVIASVEKYENAGMKFSTVPAFALAESRASDACCLFLVQHTRAKSACFPPQESSEQVAHSGSDLELHTWRTHSLDPPSCDPCRSRALPAGRRPCSLAVMRAS